MLQHNLIAEVFGEFLGLYGFAFGLTNTAKVCALPNHVQSIEFASNQVLQYLAIQYFRIINEVVYVL